MPVMVPIMHFTLCVAPTKESSCEGGEVKVIKEVNAVTIYTMYVVTIYVN